MNRITSLSSIKRSLAALWRRFERDSTASEWRRGVDQVVTDLENLNRSTERDFLAVGEKLMEFRSMARQIESDMAGMTELISGEHGRNASYALARMLEYCNEIEANIEQSGQALEQVRELSRRVRLAFAGLRNTVSIFRTLCTLTQIETSRLGNTGADFGNLTAEVGPLSESIQSSGTAVLDASDQLDQGVQSASKSGADLRATQLKELPVLIAGVMNSLKLFEDRRQCAAESATRQAAQYAAVCEAIDDLVRSVQFHDITRQQIEHVVEALRQVRSGNVESLGSDARTILTLQSSQLSEAARVLGSSIERIERDLESIAARVQDMAEGSKALMGISGDDQESFFLQMEGQFTAILKTLSICTTAQAEMKSTAARLEETIGRMRNSVGEIRGIEIRIQRISTNATIRSAHIGAAGVALTVVAEVMQRLALDSNTNTEGVAGTVDAMSDAARHVQGASGHTASGASTDEVIGNMRRMIVELHSSRECSFSRVNQIAALGTRLAEDIGAVRSGFQAGTLFAEVVQHACNELQRIGAQVGASDIATVSQTQQLENLAKHYTMQREREVHESVARGSVIAAAAPAELPVAAVPDGGLGANVELF